MNNTKNIVTKIKRNDFVHSTEGLESFLNETNIDMIIEAGGFIAGGFPRYLLQSKKVNSSYFGSTCYNADRGDVDIFFRSEDALKKSLKYLKTKTHRSRGGFALDIVIDAKSKGNDHHDYILNDRQKMFTFKTQLVNCVFGSPEEIISNFDIVNCMVGFDDEFFYTGNEEQRNIAEHENVLLLNDDKPQNSLLGWRIKKYIDRHGYKGIADASIPALKKYLVELLCDDEKLEILNKRLPERSDYPLFPTQKSAIKKLIQEMPEEELVMFIGKVQIPVRSSYGEIIIEDACIEEFNRRSGGQCD